KKTLVTKMYGNKYFGKQGETSKKTARDTRKRINLRDIELHLDKYGEKVGGKFEINLKNYKILGDGAVKSKLIIKAKDASVTAINKVQKAGGEIIISTQKKVEKSEK
ncbi:MAG: uL15 family ribosomal protein, partial [Nanoarchaeota archaeon]|nr:uL15 family ribosomal protein [Nanoarchaeota archaeon]